MGVCDTSGVLLVDGVTVAVDVTEGVGVDVGVAPELEGVTEGVTDEVGVGVTVAVDVTEGVGVVVGVSDIVADGVGVPIKV